MKLQGKAFHLVGPFNTHEASENDYQLALGIERNTGKSLSCGQKYHAVWYKISLKDGEAKFLPGRDPGQPETTSASVEAPYGYVRDQWESEEGSPPYKFRDFEPDGMSIKSCRGSKCQ